MDKFIIDYSTKERRFQVHGYNGILKRLEIENLSRRSWVYYIIVGGKKCDDDLRVSSTSDFSVRKSFIARHRVFSR